ncbi:IS3 family transposase [Corynebacterium pseudodiphtheriticum]|uniref:IS3 family transposase n=1 Tax=Corynebacterium pseudodiphtheriticum TaxID=37637 RepID=UPI003D2FB367
MKLLQIKASHTNFLTPSEELDKAIHDYVEFYNERRIKLEFGGISINQRRRKLLL